MSTDVNGPLVVKLVPPELVDNAKELIAYTPPSGPPCSWCAYSRPRETPVSRAERPRLGHLWCFLLDKTVGVFVVADNGSCPNHKLRKTVKAKAVPLQGEPIVDTE